MLCCSVYEPESRRPSLVSALSTAYTVKSLPGAMLYIPVDRYTRFLYVEYLYSRPCNKYFLRPSVGSIVCDIIYIYIYV